MAFLTQRRLDRRTALKGIGVSVALPLLEAMLPTRAAEARQMTRKLRFVAIEMVHGAAGSTAYGEKNNLWAPAEVGRGYTFGKSSLQPLENYREHLTIISRTDVRNAEAFTPPEIGGDHFRSAAVFLTQAHPHQTQGSDVKAGFSIAVTASRNGRRIIVMVLGSADRKVRDAKAKELLAKGFSALPPAAAPPAAAKK